MKKFLIIQPAFIGDVILSTALIEKIKKTFPDSEIDFLLRQGNEIILENNPHLNHIFIWNKKQALSELVKELAKIEGIEWIRLHYTFPTNFPEDVLDLIRDEPKVTNYIDIPLQHMLKFVSKYAQNIIGIRFVVFAVDIDHFGHVGGGSRSFVIGFEVAVKSRSVERSQRSNKNNYVRIPVNIGRISEN